MATPCTFKWGQTFENGMRTLFSTSKLASIGNFSSKVSAAKFQVKFQLPISLLLNRQIADEEFLYTVSGQLPPRKIAPPVRVRVWVRVIVWGQFSSGGIVLESFYTVLV